MKQLFLRIALDADGKEKWERLFAVKLIKRCADGLGNVEHFALRILVECDGAT